MADEAVEFPTDAVEVGRIAGAWGVKGGFKVLPFATDPQALFSSKRWYLRPAEGPAGRPVPALLRISQARSHGSVVVATAQDVSSRDDAEALKGARIFVARASFPTAAADEYYWVDLIGCRVFNRDGMALGNVADLLDTGAHSVLRVADDGRERLIPFVAAYVDTVDLAARTITVDWGLDY